MIASGFRSRIVHDASCPDISPVHCSESDIPDHIHDQRITFVNIQSQAYYAFGNGLQVAFFLPVQLRGSQIDYFLKDSGADYVPPYAGIHHRDEVLYGVGDAELGLQYFENIGNWMVGGGLSSSLPFGQTEENPYELGAESKAHQHFQMGTGTFVPSLELILGWSHAKHGVLSRYRLDVPLYENEYAYQTGRAQRWQVGYWHRVGPKVTLLGQALGHHEQADTWLGYTAPFSGRHALGLGGAAMVRVKGRQELMLRLERNILERSLSAELNEEEGAVPPFLLLSVGYSWL